MIYSSVVVFIIYYDFISDLERVRYARSNGFWCMHILVVLFIKMGSQTDFLVGHCCAGNIYFDDQNIYIVKLSDK